mgnify:FL=1
MALKEQTNGNKGVGIVRTIVTSFRLILQACKKKELLFLAVGLVTALFPSALLSLQKEFFSQAELLVVSPSQAILKKVIKALALWGGLWLLSWLLGILEAYANRTIPARVNNHMIDQMLNKISSLRYEYMDTPEVYNKLEWVSKELPNRISQVIYSSLGLITSLITLTSVGALVLAEDWRIAVVIISGTIPAIILMRLQNEEGYYQAQWEAPELRQQWYVYNLFVKRDGIREMRVGQYSGYLMEKWADLSLKLRNHRYKFIRKYYVFNLLSNICGYTTLGIALWLICRQMFDPASGVGIGSFVLIYGAARNLQGIMRSIFYELLGLSTTGKYIKDYFELLELDSENLTGEEEPLPKHADIVFENVSFHYPNTERLVLKDINVTIKQGEKVAIVGENGSGKSTFVALLCGLYRPQKGRITFAGRDLAESLGLMRRATSFVFQDFGRYQLTVADNIRIGDMYRELTESEIITAAKRADADSFIQEMDQKYNTFLGTLEEGRTDLSGGQWQKLGFARAITRQEAKVMVLDEQTAALDPISEAKFYHDFKELTGDRTAIMISHRLGATKLADRILVFHEGRIVEEGIHAELMQKGGLYAEMYAAQAQWYTA